MSRRPFRLLAACAVCLPLCAQTYDIVLARGRVMDPASGLDAVRYVGIREGRIAAVSASPLQGKTVVDVSGLVIAPGFIDLHSHGQTPDSDRFKARDGVTTALEMEVGVWPVAAWYSQRGRNALINFGAASGHIPARMQVMNDSGTFLPRDAAANRPATAAEIQQIEQHVRQGLDEGALGVGLGLVYLPKATRAEILNLFRIASGSKVACYVHVRSGGPIEPGVVDSVQEVIADAAVTGASLHVVHITSVGLRETPLLLDMIRGARSHGLDVTVEAYPYTAGMTDLSSAVFDPGWQNRLGGISFGDLQWAATGERLTAESFPGFRKQGGMVAVHSIPEEIVRAAIADPSVMIASDGILENGKGHPRAAGSYARVLGRYVREQHALTLMDALRKMTLLPAQRLNLTSKGHLQVGADADITVFDPARILDQATFERPAQYSTGIPHVLVNGVFVVKNGELQAGVTPGRGIRRTSAR